MTMTSTQRDRLADVRTRISDARDARAAARANQERASAGFANANHPGKATDWPEFRNAQNAVATVVAFDEQLEALSEEERYILSQMAGSPAPPRRELLARPGEAADAHASGGVERAAGG